MRINVPVREQGRKRKKTLHKEITDCKLNTVIACNCIRTQGSWVQTNKLWSEFVNWLCMRLDDRGKWDTLILNLYILFLSNRSDDFSCYCCIGCKKEVWLTIYCVLEHLFVIHIQLLNICYELGEWTEYWF